MVTVYIIMYILQDPYLSLGVGFSVEGVQQKSPCGPQQPCSHWIYVRSLYINP